MIIQKDALPPLLKAAIPLLLIAVIGIVFGIAIDFLTTAPLKWVMALIIGASLIIGAVFSGKAREIFLFMMVVSIATEFNFHLTYRQHIGVSDGFTVDSIDVWLFLGVLIWLRDIHLGKAKVELFPGTTFAMLGLIFCGLLSFINSVDIQLSTYGIVSLSKHFLFYFFVANNIRTEQDLKLVLYALGTSVLIMGAICIVQSILQVNFTAAFRIVAEDKYSHKVFRANGLSSATGTGGYFAGVLLLLFVQILIIKDNVAARLFMLLASLVGLIGLILTFTRGAWLCLLLGAIPMTYLLLRKKLIKPIHIAIPIVLIIIIAIPFMPLIEARLSEGSGNAIARFGLLFTAFNMIQEHPFIGIGLNTYVLEMGKYVSEFELHDFRYMVHNGFMLRWSEMGTFALLALVSFLAIALRRSWRLAHSNNPQLSVMGIGLFSSLIAILLNMNIETYSAGIILVQLWLVVGIIMGLSQLQHARRY